MKGRQYGGHTHNVSQPSPLTSIIQHRGYILYYSLLRAHIPAADAVGIQPQKRAAGAQLRTLAVRSNVRHLHIYPILLELPFRHRLLTLQVHGQQLTSRFRPQHGQLPLLVM